MPGCYRDYHFLKRKITKSDTEFHTCLLRWELDFLRNRFSVLKSEINMTFSPEPIRTWLNLLQWVGKTEYYLNADHVSKQTITTYYVNRQGCFELAIYKYHWLAKISTNWIKVVSMFALQLQWMVCVFKFSDFLAPLLTGLANYQFYFANKLKYTCFYHWITLCIHLYESL